MNQNFNNNGSQNVSQNINQGIDKNMKKNLLIGFGIIALLVVVFYGYKGFYKKSNNVTVKEVAQNMTPLTGKVVANFEGDNTLNYSFDIPETATGTVSEKGDLIKVTDGTSTRATVYFSYEGGRGLNPVDYITSIVAPHVSVIDVTTTKTIGNYEWQLAETGGSDWYVASINNGEWIAAIEAKKTFADEAEKLVTSFKTQ